MEVIVLPIKEQLYFYSDAQVFFYFFITISADLFYQYVSGDRSPKAGT